MTDKNFSLYNHFSTAVLILDSTGRVVFKNLSFIRTFGNIKSPDKFSNNFSFDICLLDSENIHKSSPVSFALESEETFCAHALYQKSKEQFLYFRITSLLDDGYRILKFADVTANVKYENLEKSYEVLQKKYNVLEEKNREFANVQHQAQNQAVKMTLMNKVSNEIRESIDLSKIINSALKELSELFGAIKVYYASYEDESFSIRQVYPSKFKSVVNEKIELDEKTLKDIYAKEISTSPCRKEYLNSKDTFAASVSRMIVPVYRLNDLLGILMIYTNKSTGPQNDILQPISAQLASAILQASLFKEIREKNDELEITLKELKETQLQLINSEKMASLGQLVAGVAHEINTPLASINSNNDILTKLIGKIECCDEKLLKTFDDINKIDKEAIRRISQIVQSLKKFVRLDESELQEADINKELDLTLELIRHETKNRIKVTKEYSELPKIKCYPNMLNQVFMNILINACQSIQTKNAGEGEVVIKTEYDKAAKNLIVKIKDNGIGIDGAIKDKIFTTGMTTKKVGTGLGLPISQKIIEKHNGKISFVSDKNKGTEFVIEIPDV